MGFYVRILSPSTAWVPAHVIERALRPWPALRFTSDGPPERWEHGALEVRDLPEEKNTVAVLERNVVEPGSLAESELAEFQEELEDARPALGAHWVSEWLKRVRVIHTAQLLFHSQHHEAAIDAVLEAIREATNGILQVDGEGFWNEDGKKVATTR